MIITVIFHVLVGGILVDYFQFRVVMPALSLLLAIIFASIFFIGQQSFIGWMMMFWLINLLSFAHFSCIPATVKSDNQIILQYLILSQTLSLFPGKCGSVTLGAIGLSETFSFFAFGVMNSLIFSADDINHFLVLFLTLAGVSLVAVPTTALVSRTSKSLVALAGAILAVPVTTAVSPDQPERVDLETTTQQKMFEILRKELETSKK